jgi:hypothetical protein
MSEKPKFFKTEKSNRSLEKNRMSSPKSMAGNGSRLVGKVCDLYIELEN